MKTVKIQRLGGSAPWTRPSARGLASSQQVQDADHDCDVQRDGHVRGDPTCLFPAFSARKTGTVTYSGDGVISLLVLVSLLTTLISNRFAA